MLPSLLRCRCCLFTRKRPLLTDNALSQSCHPRACMDRPLSASSSGNFLGEMTNWERPPPHQGSIRTLNQLSDLETPKGSSKHGILSGYCSPPCFQGCTEDFGSNPSPRQVVACMIKTMGAVGTEQLSSFLMHIPPDKGNPNVVDSHQGLALYLHNAKLPPITPALFAIEMIR